MKLRVNEPGETGHKVSSGWLVRLDNLKQVGLVEQCLTSNVVSTESSMQIRLDLCRARTLFAPIAVSE